MLNTNAIFSCCLKGDIQELNNLINEGNQDKLWSECRSKNGDTPLHVAARHGNIDVVRYLVEECKGELAVDSCNKLGKTVLHEAAQNTHPKITIYLIEHGADANSLKASDWTPLMLACTKLGSAAIQTIKILISHGASPFIRNKDGWTAFHIATRTGNFEVVKYLLESFPELSRTSSFNGRYPLHTACLKGHIDIVLLLVKHDISSVSVSDKCGNTPLMEACRSNHVDVMQVLLRSGASVEEMDNMGLSCVHLAAQAGCVQVIQYFIDHFNVDINLQDKKSKLTPLHCATRAGQIHVANLLFSKGADPTLQDSFGRNAKDLTYSGPRRREILRLLEEQV